MTGRGSIVSQDSQHYMTLSAPGRLRAAAFAELAKVLAIVIKSHDGIVLHRSVHATNDEDCQGTVMFVRSDEAAFATSTTTLPSCGTSLIDRTLQLW